VEEEVSAVSIAPIISKGSLPEKEEETFKFYGESDTDNYTVYRHEFAHPWDFAHP